MSNVIFVVGDVRVVYESVSGAVSYLSYFELVFSTDPIEEMRVML